MARVTTEDCVRVIPNRFELVVLAAQRARAIANGAPLLVDRDNDRNPVVALREIAEGHLKPEALREESVVSLQRYIQGMEPEYDDAFSTEDTQIKAWTEDEE